MARQLRGKTNAGGSASEVQGNNRARPRRRQAQNSHEVPRKLDWQERYGDGNSREYKKLCYDAHRSTNNKCCCCLVADSKEIHHTSYGHDKIGFSVFPVCPTCHRISHRKVNWIKSKTNPVWGNHSTDEWEERLRLGFRLLKK